MLGTKVRIGPTGDGADGGTTGNVFEGVGTPSVLGMRLLLRGASVELGELALVGTTVGTAEKLGLLTVTVGTDVTGPSIDDGVLVLLALLGGEGDCSEDGSNEGRVGIITEVGARVTLGDGGMLIERMNISSSACLFGTSPTLKLNLSRRNKSLPAPCLAVSMSMLKLIV